MNKLSNFWNTFWEIIKKTYNYKLKKKDEDKKTQTWDFDGINLLDIAVKKITNLAMVQATFDLIGDSIALDTLKKLCKALESARFSITSNVLAKGNFAVLPGIDGKGNVFHSYVDFDHFVISETDGNTITEVFSIIDEYCDERGRVYNLIRKHKLDKSGTLTIEIYTVNSQWQKAFLPQWADKETTVIIENANHIGIGIYKSPVSDRGENSIYGKPLNYKCASIEDKIIADIKNQDAEVERGKTRLFADGRILRKRGENEEYVIEEGVFPVKRLDGNGGKLIESFQPDLRIGELTGKQTADLSIYEMMLGLSKGILTDAEPTSNATATEINTANANTVAFLDNLQNAIDSGNIETLKADSILLNIPFELWQYKSDYYNAFENPQAQFDRLVTAVDKGAEEKLAITQWLNPGMTLEEAQEKLDRIKAEKQIDNAAALNQMLGD